MTARDLLEKIEAKLIPIEPNELIVLRLSEQLSMADIDGMKRSFDPKRLGIPNKVIVLAPGLDLDRAFDDRIDLLERCLREAISRTKDAGDADRWKKVLETW